MQLNIIHINIIIIIIIFIILEWQKILQQRKISNNYRLWLIEMDLPLTIREVDDYVKRKDNLY